MGKTGNEAEWARLRSLPYGGEPVYLGIDPGARGAIAWWIPAIAEAGCFNMPKTEDDLAELLRSFKECYQCHAAVEQIDNAQRGGVPLPFAFRFGLNVGTLYGVLAAMKIRRRKIRPQAWQKLAGCGRDTTRGRAQELFPEAKVTRDNAAAHVLAWVAQQVWRT